MLRILLTGNISVSISSIHAQYQKYILCISDSITIIYPGMHRSLACRSHSPEQAQKAVHFKPEDQEDREEVCQNLSDYRLYWTFAVERQITCVNNYILIHSH